MLIDDALKYIKDNKLIPAAEYKKMELKLTYGNPRHAAAYSQNIEKAYLKFGNNKSDKYFQEFLTIKNPSKQTEYIKKYSSFTGFLNKIKENKLDYAVKLSKSASSSALTYKLLPILLLTASPTLMVGMAVLARVTAPIACYFVHNNYCNSNTYLKHICSKMDLVNKEFGQNNNTANNHLNRLFTLIPQSPDFKHKNPLAQKEKYFNECVKLYKSSDRYVKTLLRDQPPEVVFSYLNEVRKELKKRNVSIDDAVKSSRFFTNKGFGAIQSVAMLKIFDNADNMISIISKSNKEEKRIADEYIDSMTGLYNKILEKNSVYKSFKVIRDIADPKAFVKDVMSEKITQSMSSKNLLNIKGIIVDVNEVVSDFNKYAKATVEAATGIPDISKGLQDKALSKITEKVSDVPKNIGESTADFIINIKEKQEGIRKNIKAGGLSRYGVVRKTSECLEKMINQIEKIGPLTEQFLNNHLTIKTYAEKIGKIVSSVWGLYDKIKDYVRIGLVEGPGLVLGTKNKFEVNFSGHAIMNHKKDLTSSIKSQLNHFKKSAERFDWNNDDIANAIRKPR